MPAATSPVPDAPSRSSTDRLPSAAWGIPTSLLLIAVAVGYLIAMNVSGILEELLNGKANSAERLLWLSVAVPAVCGVVSLLLVGRRTTGAAFAAAGTGVLALITAGAQFSFRAPRELYIAGTAGVLVALAHIIVLVLVARQR